MNVVLSVYHKGNSFVQLMTMLIVFAFVLVLTYFATRFVAKYQKGMADNKRNIQVIETFRLTTNKYIQIIRAGEKYLVVGIGKDTITMLTELSEEEIQFAEETEYAGIKFQDVLEKAKALKKK